MTSARLLRSTRSLRPPTRAVFATAAIWLAVVLVACGGQTASDEDPDAAGGSAHAGAAGSSAHAGQGGKGGKSGKGGSGGSAGRGGDSGAASAGAGGLPTYEDPGCPDPPPPLEDYACDPYGSFGGCDFDEACYPYVSYPSSTCGQEIYGAQCVHAGSGTQGESCENGCANGHLCVVTGEGTQCVQLCHLDEVTPCPGGLICASVDIPGIGGCI
jgi:hypothetical protein